jgi:hypothetical protein
VAIVREHVTAGRAFASIEELDGAFAAWLPVRRGQRHRTHGEVIAARAEADRAALHILPALPYLVADKHLRRVGKDCLVSFEASVYSVPAAAVRAGQRVEVRAGTHTIAIYALPGDGGALLAAHPRAAQRGSWVTDPQHWHGLPDGRTRAVTIDPPPCSPQRPAPDRPSDPLAGLIADRATAATPVARRRLAVYDTAAGLGTIGGARGE